MSARILYAGCPLCEATSVQCLPAGDCSHHPLYHPSLPTAINWLRCTACGHVFTDGYFTPETAALIFAGVNQHQSVGADLEKQRMISARIVEKILPYQHEGPWLDVGFGNAALLFTAAEYGFTPIGVDVRQANVDTLKALGVESYCAELTAVKPAQPCAVISMADVLEHMAFPKVGLRAVHHMLAADGVVFISMPNIDSMLWRVLDVNKANPYWGELEHYHNFSRTRLYALLRETGFEPVRYGVSERYRACMEVIAKKV